MGAQIGYLLPTREAVMEGRPEAAPLLTLAEKAEDLGYDSIWIGDSITARPRHEPLTLLAGVAGRTKRVKLGTAVLLPALRNPVVLAHIVSTLDQVSDGRVILGYGIAGDVPNIRAEFEATGVPFEKRVGRMIEGLKLCQALWTGEKVDWDGYWKLSGQEIGPVPVQKGGPPVWVGGSHPDALKRAARHFDGWFPTGPGPDVCNGQWQEIRNYATAEGRNPDDLTYASYVTIAVDDDKERGIARIDKFLEAYYGVPGHILRKRMAAFAGPAEEAAAFVKSYTDAGASHICIRFAGDHDNSLKAMSGLRAQMGG
ncbi:MAG: LLM class flavin-dependent oxidoreductase [Alphaproteobacteria bacterium]|jgi:alkanesulfonate monooxygenase SsuD/methylene tetrahydromethanopterin reductase-like flavin-dependent oxidoreductase (luciferase family)